MSETDNFQNDIARWQAEPILNLADHFHKFDSVNNQQKRVSYFEMSANDLTSFKTIVAGGAISKVEMHLGLTGPSLPNQFTVCMYLRVVHGVSGDVSFKLEPKQKPSSSTLEIVPSQFKEMIAANWEALDLHLIDDLFIGKQYGELVRVHFFYLEVPMITYINNQWIDCIETMHGLSVYAGLDMNKFYNKDLPAFTPVIGYKFTQGTIEKFKKVGIKDCSQSELFMEYSRPCPPTCETS